MSKLRDKIFNAKDIETELVYVRQWDVKIEVRGLTGTERAKVLKSAVTQDNKVDFESLYPEIVIASSYDPETGEKVFEPADKEALNKKSSAATEKIAKTAMKLSGLNESAVENAEKNL